MPNDPTGTALTVEQQRAIRSREFNEQLDRQVRNFELMLPRHVSPEKFRRVIVTAVIQDPKLFGSDRNSLFMAAQKCASDGLLPDGREAVLLPFNTKAKETLPDGTTREIWKNLVQYIPMIAGIRQRMRNTGMVASAEAHVVYRNDKFFQKFGSDPQIVHEPPQLGTDRGDAVGAYAIIRLTSGEIIQEVMDKNEIERVRGFSKAKDGPAWKGHWGEMARKTVLRRAAKSAPTSAEMLTLLQRDDESPAESVMFDAEDIEPEPLRQIEGSGVSQPHSSTGTNGNGAVNFTTKGKDALGGADTKPDWYRPLPAVPTDNQMNTWNDHIDGLLSDGVPQEEIRSAYAETIENLRRVDPGYYAGLMQKLGEK